MIELTTTMPIYTQLNSSLFDYLSRKLPEDLLNEKLKKDPEDTNRYFSQWIEQGWIKPVDLKALNGMFLEFVIFIKRGNEAGVENFDAVKNLWIEMFTNYLIIE
jgi:hypothetical protein